MMVEMQPSVLVQKIGGRYSRELGIDLSHGKSTEVYKWLLASLLFGARISEAIAEKAYREFEHAALLSPQKILDAGWDKLVGVLDRGAYVRYDFKTATKLLDINQAVMQQYKGDLNALHADASDTRDLEQRLKHLGKGIGDITANIFLRELRGIWSKANPALSERAIEAAKALGFIPARMHDPSHILQALEAAWRADRMRAKDFSEFEAALVRYDAKLRKKGNQAEIAL